MTPDGRTRFAHPGRPSGDQPFDMADNLRQSAELAEQVPSLEQWSMRVASVPSLSGCPVCGGPPLAAVDSWVARCSCGWTGRVLRPLP